MGPALRLSCRSELHVLPRFPVAQTIRSPDRSELSISPPKYFRLPDGFISIASRTICSKPSSSRCSPSLTSSQILANLSKSVCLEDISGYVLKCGSTCATRLPTFSHFELQCLVRPIRPDESASPFILDHVEQFSSVCVLADRETRPNLPPEAMTIAWLKRNAKTAFAVYETRDVGIQIHR